MSNFIHRQVGDCLVAVSGPGPLSSSDFEELEASLDRPDVHRYLSYSTGTTEVSRPQQKKTAAILRRRKTRVALINESKVTMGLVTTARLLGLVNMRVFERRHTREAVAYLAPSDGEAVLAALDTCRAELTSASSTANAQKI